MKKIIYSLFIILFLLASWKNKPIYLTDSLLLNGNNKYEKIQIIDFAKKDSIIDNIQIDFKNYILDRTILGPINSYKKYKVYIINNGNYSDSMIVYNFDVIMYNRKYYKKR